MNMCSIGPGNLAVISALKHSGPCATVLFDAVLFKFVVWLQNNTIVVVLSDHRRVEPSGTYVLAAVAGGFVGWVDERRITELCNDASDVIVC